MSRIIRYQESVLRFIKGRSCINNINNNILTKEIILEHIEDSEFLLPIILLTIMNCQSKKSHVSLHGYYMASGIEFMCIIFRMIDHKSYYIDKYGVDKYYQIISNLINYTNISLASNIESMHNTITKDKAYVILNNATKLINEKLLNITNECDLPFADSNKKSDILKYHFKDETFAKNKLSKVKQLKKDNIINYVHTKLGSLCQMTIMIGWLLGCADEKSIANFEKIGTHLSIMIKIAYDFEHIDKYLANINDNSTTTTNFIINCGIQTSFELFQESKQKFIENAMIHDMYTNTIKEIVDILEAKIDNIIEQTSPDLKSTYSSMSK
ncbi:MAG: hypothetical protein Edafosvirus12_6 [Edafosvirus sp.]|uniref:Uncharacterized protein n=1 Tax=Edafosvirus sp. TaxID=2487765 RepID=A0A3G4ZU44_9VIRU|nr:MAG: hypothetical protein Edafosvirus12_6 [Edafosvirus sp.]